MSNPPPQTVGELRGQLEAALAGAAGADGQPPSLHTTLGQLAVALAAATAPSGGSGGGGEGGEALARLLFQVLGVDDAETAQLAGTCLQHHLPRFTPPQLLSLFSVGWPCC